MVVSDWWWKVVKRRKKRSPRLDNHSFSGLSGFAAPKGEKVWNGCKLSELSISAHRAQIQLEMI